MKKKLPVATMLLSLTGALAIIVGAAVRPLRSAAADSARPVKPAAAPQSSSSQSDQTDLSVTVYNSDLSLVRDVRNLALPGGTFQLKFMDIAASVNPATVHFPLAERSRPALGARAELRVRPVGARQAAGQVRGPGSDAAASRCRECDEPEEVKATLIADNNGPVWKIGNDIVTGFNPSSIRFPELPDNLYDRPTLLWTLDNRGLQKQNVEASYLAGRTFLEAPTMF